MNSLFPQGAGKAAVPRSVWTKRATIALPLLCLMIFGTIIGANLIGRATGAGASSLIPLKGHVPGLVKTSTLVGPTDANQSISLSIGLQLRNAESLKSYVDNISYVKSAHVQRHLTSAQIATSFAPLASSEKSVIDYMQSYGFHVTMTLSQHLVIGFQGTVGDAENAFHIQINNYHSAKGQEFYAPASEPMVPSNLAGLIQNVAGLDNAAHFTHPPTKLQPKSTANVSANSVSCQAAGWGTPGGNWAYIPGQLASAYGMYGFYNNNHFFGEGQLVGLVEFDDFNLSDINAYTQCYGPSNAPINRIKVDNGSGPIGPGAVEAELDMELILSVAPHLAALNVYEAPNTTAGSNDMWAKIINADAVPVVSTSWGLCEAAAGSAELQFENNLFAIAAAQGQTIVAAAGDHGTDDCQIFLPPHGKPTLAVDDPASQPYVTGVGGTELTVVPPYDSYSSETTWNQGTALADNNGDQWVWAGGGGISNQWAMPSWQQGPGVINSYSSGTSCGTSGGYCREVPDVSLSATNYLLYCTVGVAGCSGGSWWIIGGTSAAAPMWAAFMALTNEKTLHDGGFNIGFINPYLYQISQNAGGTSYSNDFHDITVGNNDGLGDGGTTYPATANYDMATGLGSYNALNLANDLEKLAASGPNGTRQAPAATKWYFAEGSVGGGFQEWLTVLNPSAQTATVTVQYLFTNAPAQSKTYTVAASSRFTINVNSELGVPQTGGHVSISAIVTSTVPVVVERPMYFNLWNTVPSGTDVLGATKTNTVFYFAQGDERQNSSINSAEFITMLNPNTDPAAAPITVTATYFSGGQQVGSDTITIPSLQRGTIAPSYKGQAAIKLTASQGIVAERPIYIKGAIPGLNGTITGAASAVGATDLGGANGSDWLFAEGHTSGTFQENLVLANFTTTDTTATVKLEYSSSNGSTPTPAVLQCTVKALSQFSFNVNNPSGNGCSVQSLGTPTNNVSAEVTAPTASIVAERVMYFQFGTGPGMTDVVGQPASANQTTYSFAEGYTGGTFSEWLTLQNPTSQTETVALTFFADNMIIEKEITLPPTSRTTILVNDLINPIVNAYPAPGLHNVSMVIQALNGGSVIAERPMYFNYGGDTGGTDVIGYTGN